MNFFNLKRLHKIVPLFNGTYAKKKYRFLKPMEIIISCINSLRKDLYNIFSYNIVKNNIIISTFILLISKILIISNIYLYKIIIDSLSQKKLDSIFIFILLYGFLKFFSTLIGELKDLQFGKVSYNIISKIAIKLFDHFHELGFSFFIQNQAGDLSRKTEKGLQAIELLARHFICHIFPLMTEMLLICAFLIIFYTFEFSVIIFFTFCTYIFYTIQITSKRMPYRKKMNAADTAVYFTLCESLLNFETIKSFSLEEKIKNKFGTVFNNFKNLSLINIKMIALLNIGQSLIICLGLTITMVTAVFHYQQDTISLGDFVLLNLFVFQAFIPLVSLGYIYREISQSILDLRTMNAIFSEKNNIKNSPKPTSIDSIESVFFNGVGFSYDHAPYILRNLSFHIKSGQKVGIVGLSGVGKSTIIRLLMRFFDVTYGSIKINGIDVKELELKNFRSFIGIVPQNILLFRGTIYENLTCWDNSVTKIQVERAAKFALIHNHILSLPNGYETLVGDGLLRLSAGERQRIAIARLLIRKPALWILDEPTSSLDFQTEKRVQENMNSLSAHNTVVTIAHRLHTIMHCDEIIYIKKGKIAERGNHKDLIKLNGLYSKLWNQQNRITSTV